MKKIEKNDFVEIEYKGFFNGELFDTTNEEEAKKLGIKNEVKPIIISVGNGMILKGLDEDLIGKEIGKTYKLHLKPEKAFGKRDPSLIRLFPMNFFIKNKINPQVGLIVQIDNFIAKIISVSGGRITVDFNNPLAGKEVDYEYRIIRLISEPQEKVNALQDYFFKKRFEFEVKDNKVIFKDIKIKPLIEIFKKRFEEITGFIFEVEENIQEEVKENIQKESKN